MGSIEFPTDIKALYQTFYTENFELLSSLLSEHLKEESINGASSTYSELVKKLAEFYSNMLPTVEALFSQTGYINVNVNPELNLHAKSVEWIDSTHIRVTYDWSDANQLLDWEPTGSSSLSIIDDALHITAGTETVNAMNWNTPIKCNKITVNMAPSSQRHCNIYTNLAAKFDGSTWNPVGLGSVWNGPGILMIRNSEYVNLTVTTGPTQDVYNTHVVTIEDANIIANCTSDNIDYEYAGAQTKISGYVSLGAYGGYSNWKEVVIEGEISIPWWSKTIPSNSILFETIGSTFNPILEILGEATISWSFGDGQVSSEAAPNITFTDASQRSNYVTVTPWSALKGINVGYDAGDNGYAAIALHPQQNVIGIRGLEYVRTSLQYLAASNNPLQNTLNISNFTDLSFIELYYCTVLSGIVLGTQSKLERLCLENCNLSSLDISGCTELEDLRAASNNYPSINWGNIGSKLWHICTVENPQLIANMPALSQFPLIRELWLWNDNQSGALTIHNTNITSLLVANNHYTSLDVSGCSSLQFLNISYSPLTAITIDVVNLLVSVNLSNCNLSEALVDYVLERLDGSGVTNGTLNISANSSPSLTGESHITNLQAKGWGIVTS